CALCLSTKDHSFVHCNADTLWSGGKTHVHRNDQNRLTFPDGEAVCIDWQRNCCQSGGHSERHRCS
ncbi:hypothetical protein FA95DRAFT_1463686, partial [Auriscalpium vulgare]